MERNELDMLTQLLEEDDFAKGIAMGLSSERAAALGRLRAMQPWQNERYSNSDIGNGFLFADFHKDTARFVSERKCWFIYDGSVWRADVGNLKAMEKCKELATLLFLLTAEIKDTALRDVCIKRASRWHNRGVRETILKDSASVYCLRREDFDRDHHLFNCLNGTLNLRTGEFREHRPEDLLTMMSGVNYDKEARCPRWERFMTEIMATGTVKPEQVTLADVEAQQKESRPSASDQKKRYLQKAFGYALTGNTRFECLFILYGATTRNGKGTAMETFLRLMGDYGKTARPETIGTRFQQNSNAPSEDVARLNGARFVNISEPDKKLTLSAALVKSLTGNDTITARFLHENSFEYRPQFKMFINTNYLPQITDLTLFSSGRIKTIPFERHFEEYEQDKRLKELFALPENLSDILNWCIEGLQLLDIEGFDEPEIVRQATKDYAHNSDKMALFMEECLLEESGAMCRTSRLYGAYSRWCEENGFHAENVRNFRSLLAGYGQVDRRRPSPREEKTTVLLGYRLRDYAEPLLEPADVGAYVAARYITPYRENRKVMYFTATTAPAQLLLLCS